MKIILFFLTLLFSVFIFSTCCKDIKFATINKAPIGTSFKVTGYFSNDPIPMLVKDTIWLRVNTPMPKNEYILLQGTQLDSARSPYAKTYGARVTVRGTVVKTPDSLGNGNSLLVKDINVNSADGSIGLNPPILDLCALDPSLKNVSVANPQKFALLYSGGGSEDADAKNRYWNDLAFMYLTLKSQYGYSDENIVLVYKDGRQPKYANGAQFDPLQVKVDFAAKLTGLKRLDLAIAFLQDKMALVSNPSLFVFTTNHGGGYRIASHSPKDGIVDAVGGDEVPLEPAETTAAVAASTVGTTSIGPTAFDETIFLYRDPVEYISDEVWASKINSLVQVNGTNRLLITVNEPCFSGGWLKDLRGLNRINISAPSEGEYSYGLADGRFDEFSYHFTAALHGKYPRLGPNALNSVSGFVPGNGVSILEAYWYATNQDTSDERSLLDDNTDGIGTEILVIPPIGDGVFASSIFL